MIDWIPHPDWLDWRSLTFALYVITGLYVVALHLGQAARYRRGNAGSFSCANWLTQILMRTGPLAYGLAHGVWLLAFLVSLDILGRMAVLAAVLETRRRQTDCGAPLSPVATRPGRLSAYERLCI